MQKFNSSTKIIIGVDHGYGNMKTAHRIFKTGVECMEEEPIVSRNFVKYKDKFYVIGESHLVYQGNKTESEDFHILTLAALAEELMFRGLHEANVTLAVGLPLAWMKSQGADFKRYLLKEQELHFEFRKERYHVHLCGVEVFPQGFAAIVNLGTMLGMNMLADIGNGTMNVMQIIDNKPLEKSLVTDKFGVGICMKEIQKELSKENGEDIPEMLIEPLLWNGIQGRTDVTAAKVERIAKQYAENIRKRLVDYGYKEGLVHLYVIGGGGCLLRNYTELAGKAEVIFITDICANAKGYEYLAAQNSADRGNAMRKTYKCSNIKFCMEDENQRRTWEYLQGMTRKDGSYGKILSDAFVEVLDSKNEIRADKSEELLALSLKQSEHEFEQLKEMFARVLEGNFRNLQEILTEHMEKCFQECISNFQVGAVKAAEVVDSNELGQMQEAELSEDMMAFAFTMGE